MCQFATVLAVLVSVSQLSGQEPQISRVDSAYQAAVAALEAGERDESIGAFRRVLDVDGKSNLVRVGK